MAVDTTYTKPVLGATNLIRPEWVSSITTSGMQSFVSGFEADPNLKYGNDPFSLYMQTSLLNSSGPRIYFVMNSNWFLPNVCAIINHNLNDALTTSVQLAYYNGASYVDLGVVSTSNLNNDHLVWKFDGVGVPGAGDSIFRLTFNNTSTAKNLKIGAIFLGYNLDIAKNPSDGYVTFREVSKVKIEKTMGGGKHVVGTSSKFETSVELVWRRMSANDTDKLRRLALDELVIFRSPESNYTTNVLGAPHVVGYVRDKDISPHGFGGNGGQTYDVRLRIEGI